MLSRIEANLNSFKPAINELPERRASVLMPLLEREGQTLILLTKRSEKITFPFRSGFLSRRQTR